MSFGKHDSEHMYIFQQEFSSIEDSHLRELIIKVSEWHESYHDRLFQGTVVGNIYSLLKLCCQALKDKSHHIEKEKFNNIEYKLKELHNSSFCCQETYATYLSIISLKEHEIECVNNFINDSYYRFYSEIDEILSQKFKGSFIKFLLAMNAIKISMNCISDIKIKDVNLFFTEPLKGTEKPDNILSLLLKYYVQSNFFDSLSFLIPYFYLKTFTPEISPSEYEIINNFDADSVWYSKNREIQSKVENHISDLIYNHLAELLKSNFINVITLGNKPYYHGDYNIFMHFYQQICGYLEFTYETNQLPYDNYYDLRAKRITDEIVVNKPLFELIGVKEEKESDFIEHIAEIMKKNYVITIRIADHKYFVESEQHVNNGEFLKLSSPPQYIYYKEGGYDFAYGIYLNNDDENTYKIKFCKDSSALRNFLRNHCSSIRCIYYCYDVIQIPQLGDLQDELNNKKMILYIRMSFNDTIDSLINLSKSINTSVAYHIEKINQDNIYCFFLFLEGINILFIKLFNFFSCDYAYRFITSKGVKMVNPNYIQYHIDDFNPLIVKEICNYEHVF